MCQKSSVEGGEQGDKKDGGQGGVNNTEVTKEEIERKVREHIERRKKAYVKMGTVDEPRD